MGKAKARPQHPQKYRRKSKPRIGRRKFVFGSTGMVAAGLVAGFGLYRFTRVSSPTRPEKPFGPADLVTLPRHERRQTLSPSLFTGRVAAAYAVAREIPALLDQLYCYCRCKETVGHKTLLSCYVGSHAAT